MKISLIVIAILLSAPSASLLAQVTGSKDTAIIKQNFDNKKAKPGSKNLFPKKDIQRRKENTIIVINKKIYSVDSKEYRSINRDEIINLEIIKDESSATQIKNIIIIETKVNTKKDG